MSKDRRELRDRLVKATKRLMTEIDHAKRNPDLSESARTKQITEARKRFSDISHDVLEELKPSAAEQRPDAQATVSPELLSALKETLNEAENPTLAMLDLLARGTDEMIETVASQDGLQLVEQTLRKNGEPESIVQRTMQQLTGASRKRSQQPSLVKPDTANHVDNREARFWNHALPAFVIDVEQALDHGHRTVVFPATSGSNEEPIVVDLAEERG